MLSKAAADEPAERRKSSALGHQTLADIIPQDKQIWNQAVQVMKGWEGTPLTTFTYINKKGLSK